MMLISLQSPLTSCSNQSSIVYHKRRWNWISTLAALTACRLLFESWARRISRSSVPVQKCRFSFISRKKKLATYDSYAPPKVQGQTIFNMFLVLYSAQFHFTSSALEERNYPLFKYSTSWPLRNPSFGSILWDPCSCDHH